MLILEKRNSLKIFKFQFKLRRVEEDDTENTGQTEGTSFSKCEAQGEGDAQEAEEVENGIEVQEEQYSVKATILPHRWSVASPCSGFFYSLQRS